MPKKKLLLVILACLVLAVPAYLARVTILAHVGIARYQNRLGIKYSNASNYAKASIWFEKASNKNLAEAQFNYGNLFETGQGEEKDLSVARMWYQKSADQGYVPAIEALRRLRPKHRKIVLSQEERDLAVKICEAWRAFEDFKAATSRDDVAGQQKVITLYNTYYHLRDQFKVAYGERREARLDTDMRQYGLCQDLE